MTTERITHVLTFAPSLRVVVTIGHADGQSTCHAVSELELLDIVRGGDRFTAQLAGSVAKTLGASHGPE